MTITNTYLRIPLNLIEVQRDTRQRKEIEVSDLVQSIKLHGVLQPILVEQLDEDRFRLLIGERRLAASRQLKLLDIPARLAEGLDETERQIYELIENVQRHELPWKEECVAVAKIHKLFVASQPNWTQSRTASALGYDDSWITINLMVAEQLLLGNKLVESATGLKPAYNVLQRANARRVDDTLNELLAAPAVQAVPISLQDKYDPQKVVTIRPRDLPHVTPADESIISADFLAWAPAYSGEPFSVIHCDFPYGIEIDESIQAGHTSVGSYGDSPEVYVALMECLCKNLDRLMYQSGHLIFWCKADIDDLAWARNRLEAAGLGVNPRPLIWHKTDKGIMPDHNRSPRYQYEAALFCSRGDRYIIKPVSNIYAAQTTREVHPSEKSKPMLAHFLSMVVDEHTRFLDPTCGSASALRAAELLGANYVLGLELDPVAADAARAVLKRFRTLRALERTTGAKSP